MSVIISCPRMISQLTGCGHPSGLLKPECDNQYRQRPRTVQRASLYRGQINLWVEDEPGTRAYLSAVWDSPVVAFFIGGGSVRVFGQS